MAVRSLLPRNFFLFVLLAFIFWMLSKFSKEYEATVLFNVVYEGLPEDKIFQSKPPEQIPIHIKGSGFKLISAKLFSKKIKLNTGNLTNYRGTQYYILLNQQELDIEKQLSNGLSIDYFVKDSVFFDLGTLATKKVPVFVDADVNFSPGYDFVNGLKSQPDSVFILGPKAVLDTINQISTSEVVAQDVHSNLNVQTQLLLPDDTVKFVENIAEVNVVAEVDKFTEGVFEVPFIVDNLPDDISLSTFPKTVKVSFKVGLSDFNKINENSFTIRCDYEFSFQNNLTYLIPRLDSKPNLVKQVKIAPGKIDFLIQK